MKKILLILLCLVTIVTLAQTPTEYGNWFYESSTGSSANIAPKSHFQPSTTFSSTSVRGDNHKVPFSANEKNKLLKIIDVFKEVYPKPKYHSIPYWLFPMVPDGRKVTQAMVDKRQYRFSYFLGIQNQFMALDNGKPVAKFNALKFGRQWDFLNINVNSIIDVLGGKKGDFDNAYFGPTFIIEEDFTYKKYNGNRALPLNGSEERAAFPRYPTKEKIVSITNRAESFVEAKKHLGENFGIPPFAFKNEADSHFVYRRFISSRLHHSGLHLIYGKVEPKFDRNNYHTIHNMVILSHNNKLPFIPLTIESFLNIGNDIIDEVIAHDNTYIEDVSIKKELNEKNQRTKKFIQLLRETYTQKLQQQAIIDVRYAHISDFAWGHIYLNQKTKQEEVLNLLTDKREPFSQVLSKFFITDTKHGKAFYTYDKDFYKNMADGEIRTICVVWKDLIRLPDHKDYGNGFQITNNEVMQNRFSDNPDFYLYHFNKKFDWSKIEAVMGK